MKMTEALVSYYRRYFDFSGRSTRSEFWWVCLFNTVVITLILTGMILSPGVFESLYWLFWIINIIPGIAIWVRRFHDQDKSGWFSLLFLAPFGMFIVCVFMCFEGTKGPNRFGYDPLGGTADVFD